QGTYVQRGFLPRWLAVCFSVFVALAMAFVMLWIAYKPQVRTAATELTGNAGVSTLAPVPSSTTEALEAPSAEAVAPPAAAETQAPDAAGDAGAGPAAGAGSGGGGAEEEEESEAAEETAASAVRRLAADDPGGQHICYRVHARGAGWSDV
ncbi:hydrolase, partial [Streptomyces sp. TRM76130]|nr:hydrolase [Streptomyces sp. TRM76130]